MNTTGYWEIHESKRHQNVIALLGVVLTLKWEFWRGTVYMGKPMAVKVVQIKMTPIGSYI